MSKIKSWDRFANQTPSEENPCPSTDSTDNFGYHIRVRCVVWPEGAPDPSKVPHAGEEVQTISGEVVTVESGRPMRCATRSAGWLLTCRSANDLLGRWSLDSLTRIPDAPTVKIGEKTYNLADAVARCEPLEAI